MAGASSAGAVFLAAAFLVEAEVTFLAVEVAARVRPGWGEVPDVLEDTNYLSSRVDGRGEARCRQVPPCSIVARDWWDPEPGGHFVRAAAFISFLKERTLSSDSPSTTSATDR